MHEARVDTQPVSNWFQANYKTLKVGFRDFILFASRTDSSNMPHYSLRFILAAMVKV